MNPARWLIVIVTEASCEMREQTSMSAHAKAAWTGWAIGRSWYTNGRRTILAATALLIVGALWLALGIGNAATTIDAVPVDDALAADFSLAATSCSALTPARLAAQVMAATGFKPTPEGGIGGLTAPQLKVWKPSADASPSNQRQSILALAHMTCDLVGQARVAKIPGDRWRLAVAASRSSIKEVKDAAGIPPLVAAYVDRVDAYAAYYAGQPGLGGPAAVLSTPTPSATRPGPTATPTPTELTVPTQSVATGPPSIMITPTSPDAVPPSTNAPVQIVYGSFADASGLQLSGAAHVSGGRLDLAAGSNEAASAWSTTRIDLSKSFSALFVVMISDITDGVAFVVRSPSAADLGNAGGAIGYGAGPGDSVGPITPSVALELDTWDNSPDGFDPPGHQHVALTANGDQTKHLIWRDPGFSMWGNGPVYIWITYDASAQNVTVYAATTSAQPATALFSFNINLAAVVGNGSAYVGFTGGTGLTSVTDAEESILAWSLTSG